MKILNFSIGREQLENRVAKKAGFNYFQPKLKVLTADLITFTSLNKEQETISDLIRKEYRNYQNLEINELTEIINKNFNK